jgi:hypothetical protein
MNNIMEEIKPQKIKILYSISGRCEISFFSTTSRLVGESTDYRAFFPRLKPATQRYLMKRLGMLSVTLLLSR